MPVVCNKFDGPGIPASNMLHTTASSPKKQALGARRTRTRGPKASRHIKDAPHNQRKGSGFVRPGVRGRPQPHNRGCVQPAQGRRRMMGERPAAGICRANGKSAIMDTRAGMAQWQSNGFVNRGLGVRLPLPAPGTRGPRRARRGPVFCVGRAGFSPRGPLPGGFPPQSVREL